MELVVFNEQFEEMGRIDDFLSLQWTRKYYDVGNFECNLSNEYFSLLDQASYVYRPDCNELACLENIESTLNAQGSRELRVSGKLVEVLLNDRVIESECDFSGTEAQIAQSLVKKHFVDSGKKRVSFIELGNVFPLSSNISKQYKDGNIMEIIYELLKEKNLSQRLRFDYMRSKLIYEVWQGKDRTTDQNENEWMIFSDNNETISEFDYSRDISDQRNVCYVVGDNLTVEVDRSQKDRRKEMVLKSSSSRKKEDESEMSEEEYYELLYQEGIEELESRKTAEKFNGTVHNVHLKYREDYDLGDLCTCYVVEIGKIADKRIIEIREVYENGDIKVTPVFGEEGVTVSTLLKRTSR